jgi:dihydropteroate synthase
LIMGVINVTPDSFSDGGLHFEAEAARRRIDELVQEGAQILDIGGESTRPGAAPVAAQEQIRRTRGAVQHAVGKGVLVSIDTTHPDVAREATRLGASIVNDVSCLRQGGELARVAADAGASLIIMHARAPMSEMKGFSVCAQDAYGDVVQDVRREWTAAAEEAERAGMMSEDVLFDPGLGFNKNARHSSELLARLDEFAAMGHDMVVGPSRKSFLCADVKTEPSRRLGGTVAACLASASRGASILRVHDVLEVRQALGVARAIGLRWSAAASPDSRGAP